MPEPAELVGYVIAGTRYLLPLLMLWVLARCLRSMLRERYEPETWAYLVDANGLRTPVNHWECIIGRSRSCDVVLSSQSVSRVHASLQRDGSGYWTVSDLRSRGGTFVNGDEAELLYPVRDGDVLDFAGEELVFQAVTRDEREWLERRRTAPGRFVGPGVTLLILSLFQAFSDAGVHRHGGGGVPLPHLPRLLRAHGDGVVLLPRDAQRAPHGLRAGDAGLFPDDAGHGGLRHGHAGGHVPPDHLHHPRRRALLLPRRLAAEPRARQGLALSRRGGGAGPAGRERRVQRGRLRREELAEHRGRQLPALRARQGALHLHRRGDARQALRAAEPLCVHRLFRHLRHRPGAHRRLRHGGHLLCDLPRHLLHALGQLRHGVPRGLRRGHGGLPGAIREALYRRALLDLGPRLGGRLGQRLSADPRHERRRLRRALRQGRGRAAGSRTSSPRRRTWSSPWSARSWAS